MRLRVSGWWKWGGSWGQSSMGRRSLVLGGWGREVVVGKKRHGRPYLGRREPSACLQAVCATHAAITPQTFQRHTPAAGAIFPLLILDYSFVHYPRVLHLSSKFARATYTRCVQSRRSMHRSSIPWDTHSSIPSHSVLIDGPMRRFAAITRVPIILRLPSAAQVMVAFKQHADRRPSQKSPHFGGSPSKQSP